MMTRNLAVRLDKLEDGNGDGGDVAPFYLLWVQPGADRAAAVAELRKGGKVSADLPAFCAEWRVPKDYERQSRELGPRPRSRLTNHQRISDDEKRILWEAIAELELAALEGGPIEKPDERTRQMLVAMTDRELIGAIICGSERSGAP